MTTKGARNMDALRRKIDALKEAMAREKLAAMLFYSSGQLSMLEVNAVLWLSGVTPMGPNTAVLLRPSGEATMIIGLPLDEGRVREQTWIGDIRVADNVVGEIGNLLVKHGIRGDIGIAGYNFIVGTGWLTGINNSNYHQHDY